MRGSTNGAGHAGIFSTSTWMEKAGGSVPSWIGIFSDVSLMMMRALSMSARLTSGWPVTYWRHIEHGSPFVLLSCPNASFCVGLLMSCQEYWDKCREAGPAKRTATEFSEPMPSLEVLAVDHGKLKLHG